MQLLLKLLKLANTLYHLVLHPEGNPGPEDQAATACLNGTTHANSATETFMCWAYLNNLHNVAHPVAVLPVWKNSIVRMFLTIAGVGHGRTWLGPAVAGAAVLTPYPNNPMAHAPWDGNVPVGG